MDSAFWYAEYLWILFPFFSSEYTNTYEFLKHFHDWCTLHIHLLDFSSINHSIMPEQWEQILQNLLINFNKFVFKFNDKFYFEYCMTSYAEIHRLSVKSQLIRFFTGKLIIILRSIPINLLIEWNITSQNSNANVTWKTY